MDVRCEKCSTEYEFEEGRIGANGVTVKCTACGYVFKVRRPSTSGRSAPPRASTHIGKGPQGREWLVKKPDGQMIAFRELTTLQKWIVEGRIVREDEISKNGETWKRLGNILELEPFFSVYEKAQALNSLIDQAGSPSRIELRGSEVLSAASPVPTIGFDVGPRSAVTAIPLQLRQAPAEMQATLPPPPPPQPAPTLPIAPVTGNGAGHAPAHHGPGPGSSPANPMRAQSASRPSPPARRDSNDLSLDLTPPPPSGGGLERSLQLNTLDLPLPDRRGRHADDDDDDDELQPDRRGRVVLFSVLLVLAAGGGVVAAGVYGPEGNQIREALLRYDLIKPAKDDGAYKLVEDASHALDLDTLQSQQQGLTLLAEAQQRRPSDGMIAAQRALHGAMYAATFQRWAEDLEAAATRAEDVLNRWKEQKKELKKQKDGEGEGPPKPSTPEPRDLRALAKEKHDLSERALADALVLALKAERVDASSLETSRALAACRLVKKDPVAFAEALGRAKSATEKVGRADAITLYLEAASFGGGNDAANIDKALGLLDQALTTRPTLLRARVLQARLLLAKGELDQAKRALDQALTGSPEHEEAKRLADELQILAKKKEEEEALKKTAPPPTAPPPADAATPPPTGVEPSEGGEPKSFEYWMETGDRLRERDKTRQALNAYGRAAELRPDSAETHTGKGWCFLDMEKPRLALTSFQRAIEVNEKYADAYYGMAESQRALGNNAEAIRAYERYLSRAPQGSAERKAAQRTLEELKKL